MGQPHPYRLVAGSSITDPDLDIFCYLPGYERDRIVAAQCLLRSPVDNRFSRVPGKSPDLGSRARFWADFGGSRGTPQTGPKWARGPKPERFSGIPVPNPRNLCSAGWASAPRQPDFQHLESQPLDERLPACGAVGVIALMGGDVGAVDEPDPLQRPYLIPNE